MHLLEKKIVPTSQEICTSNLCAIYNKPFNDGYININSENSCLRYVLPKDCVNAVKWDTSTKISTSFNSLIMVDKRLCIIDTPGVNSVINKNHGEISKNTIKKGLYDKLVYILNANKLGTNEEFEYLNWIVKNVDHKKIVFVLNKVDEFRKHEDSLKVSIEKVRDDLNKIGFINPKIIPLSAYFSLLVKLKFNNISLTEDEEDEYDYLLKKINRNIKNLTSLDEINADVSDDMINLCKKSGLYDLEKELYM